MSLSTKRVRRIPQLPERPGDSHKGTFGRVLIIGGSVGMAGAPSLAGLSALRSGAGLVTIAVPAGVQPTVAALCPCATTLALPETQEGQIDPVLARKALKKHGWIDPKETPPDVLIAGPGLGRGPRAYGRQVWALIDAFRQGAGVPAVIDADALNLAYRSSSAARDGWDNRPHPRTIITPHPGELARMLDTSAGKIQSSREEHAVETARLMQSGAEKAEKSSVVVLKGAGTIVTDGTRIYTNQTGNAGMATGGSGDVLSGIIAALVGQGMDVFDAAVSGVHLHGLAGDLAVRDLGQVSLIATDLIDALPPAFLTRQSKRTSGSTRSRREAKS